MFIRDILLPLTLSASLALSFPTPYPSDPLPTVDLGYGVYRASFYNETWDAYVFSNIRFAAPPIGNLRFSPPQPPVVDRSKVHDGSEGFVCPSALSGSPILPPLYDSPQSEDCLFLDVIVPRQVLSGDLGQVPVAFWIFGGAYTMGSKNSFGDPITFLKHSPSPVIWVAINHRLGHFGFLAGPTLTLASGAIANAGLHDQRFGLQWVQDNIHLFGGNKDEVTMMGVSAGAGSALHHITAYGGRDKPAMFKRVMPLGPGFFTHGGHASKEEEYSEFEAAVGCAGKGVDCIRAASTETLMKANKDIITALKAPRTGPGPSVDGNYVPDPPAYLLAQGRFHKNITVLVLDDSDEGAIFMDPNSTLTAPEAVDDLFPQLSSTTRSALLAFYPPPSNTTIYTTELARFASILSDSGFNHNRYALSTALPTHTYNVVSAGFHGTGATNVFIDVPGGYDSVVAEGMRRWVMNFVVTGNPNEVGGGVAEGVSWPVYGEGWGLQIDGKTMKVVDARAGDKVWGWWVKEMLLS